MAPDGQTQRVAIACQGGGSHTAFTAGCLEEMLRQRQAQSAATRGPRWEIAGLSGSSGGAICALLAWSVLLGAPAARPEEAEADEPLAAFWRDAEATSLLDIGLNWAVVAAARANVFPELSPYDARPFLASLDWWDAVLAFAPLQPPSGWFPTRGPHRLRQLWDARERLKALLDQHVPFVALRQLWEQRRAVDGPIPKLLVGAASVLDGSFKVFRSDQWVYEVDVDAILASTAIPTLVEALRRHDASGNHVYWDALFSQNPPVRDFVSVPNELEEAPDEIWVIQINPSRTAHEPRRIGEILDRRNELTGNLSLNQELDFIKSTNKWLLERKVSPEHFKPIRIYRIELTADLDLASKMDRSRGFLEELMTCGRQAGSRFLQAWRAQRALCEVLPLTVRLAPEADYRAVSKAWQELRSCVGSPPSGAELTQAGRLVQRIMRARGYPVADFIARLSDISATDPQVAQQYLPTMALVLRAQDGRATRQERQIGWDGCASLLEHLLDRTQPPPPTFPAAPTLATSRTAWAAEVRRLAPEVGGAVL
jgi:NTE family protein